MAVEDFGGKVLGAPIQVVVADHHDSPDQAAAIARDWFGDQHVDAIMDVSGSSEALIVQAIADTRDKIVILNAPGANRLTEEGLHPDLGPLHQRHLRDRPFAGPRDRRQWRRYLVFHHRRLQLRLRPRRRDRRGRQGEWRHGPRPRPPPAQRAGFLVLSAAGAAIARQGHRARQWRRRHRATRSSAPRRSA